MLLCQLDGVIPFVIVTGMNSMKRNSLLCIMILFLCFQNFAQNIKRGRNEGTVHIPAANVMGNANITAYADIAGVLTKQNLWANARFGGAVGVADILQFNMQTTVINFSRLGPTEAHLQITTPGNDRLRFLGIALRGDLYLSTSLDTIGKGAESEKPEYNPYPLFTVIADLDWIARTKQIPLKTYCSFSLVDDPVYLFAFHQIALKAGIEWKQHVHSLFFDFGINFYKEKNHTPDFQAAYDQYYAWIGPGGRYRLKNRLSILGSADITVTRKIKDNTLFTCPMISLTVKIEAPLIFKETNAEAVRTLIFMEDRKAVSHDTFTSPDSSAATFLNSFGIDLDELGDEEETFDYREEKDALIKRRLEIQKKMEEIEKLLKKDMDNE